MSITRASALIAVLAVASALLFAGCEPAGTDFAVDSTLDLPDASPGNGVCRAPGGTPRCTLRAAVEEANANDEINDLIYVPDGTYPLGSSLVLLGSMFIVGQSTTGTTLDPSGNDRSITVGNGAGADPIVSISKLTMTGASLQSTNGAGGLWVRDEAGATLTQVHIRDNNAGITGGGVRNDGFLDIRRSEVRDNQIGNGATFGGGVTSTGGGIYNTGVLKVSDSTIEGNESARGGGIANVGGDVDLTNSTVTGNIVYEGGAGLYNTSVMGQPAATAVFNIATSTITLNEANHEPGSDKVRPWGGGLLNLSNAQVNIGKSVIAGNIDNRGDFSDDFSPDCYSVIDFRFTSHRSNLVGILTDNCELRDTIFGNTGGITFGTADDPLDPELGGLGANGGPTRTHSVSATSPLVDAATSGSSADFFDCPEQDQRGIPRPLDGDTDGTVSCDIGAVELFPTDDGDGVSGATEDGAANNGDGNDDGIPDRWQPNVASLPASAPGSPKVTFVVSGPGERIEQVNTVSNPDPATDPVRLFPIGYWNLDAVPGPDGEVRVTILLPLGVTATQWWNHGPEPGVPANHWWQFTYDGQTGLSGLGGVLSLDFVDGQRGDRGGTVNGHVTAIGGAARSLFCVMETATIIGTDGPETINGTGAKDVIVAMGGNDTVNGLGGNDVICAGAGGDTVNGGNGNDHILGEEGNDHLFGNDGADDLDGGTGFDVLRGGAGADTVVNGEDSIP